MRQIGTIADEQDAERFGAFLVTLGINNNVEESSDGWAIWVENDDHLDRARAELEKFQAAPGAAHYTAAVDSAADLEAERQELEQRRRDNFVDVRTRQQRQERQWNVPITMLLFGVSVVVTLLTHGWDPPRRWIDQSPLQNTLRIAPVDMSGHYQGLDAIKHGEVWRIITPIFLHFGLLHIVFNMMWLLDLGALIESRKGPIFYAIFILIAAAASNLAQYYWDGPNFGGMSGVVYALFGYAWIKGRFDPASNISVRPETAGVMLVWLVLCMTGVLGDIANTAHLVGLIVGVAFAYTPYAIAQKRRR